MDDKLCGTTQGDCRDTLRCRKATTSNWQPHCTAAVLARRPPLALPLYHWQLEGVCLAARCARRTALAPRHWCRHNRRCRCRQSLRRTWRHGAAALSSSGAAPREARRCLSRRAVGVLSSRRPRGSLRMLSTPGPPTGDATTVERCRRARRTPLVANAYSGTCTLVGCRGARRHVRAHYWRKSVRRML